MTKLSHFPIFAVLLLAGCQGDSSPVPATAVSHAVKKAPVPAKRGPTPEELTVGMVEAVPLGKNTAPIAVKFDLPERPSLGQPLEIVIALLPQVAGSAALQVTSSSGLQLAPGVGSISVPAIEPTQAYRMSIAVTPTAEGVQLLNLDVTVVHEDTSETRSYSVPVIVAAAAEAVAVSKR